MLVIALLAALIAWAVTSGGGSGGGQDDGKPGGSGPAPSITPGPSSSGPVTGQPPGGRDESDDSGTDAGSGASGGSAGTGTGGAGGSGTGGDTGAGTAGPGGSASGAGTGGSAAGQQVPAGSKLPNCTPTVLQLSLKTEISFGPDDKPKFRLSARNTSAADCKADFGPKNAVLTITEAGEDDEQVWSSKDCPKPGGALFLRVPAGTTVVHTVEWDRKGSAPSCATPPVRSAGPGTYLLEAKVPGESVQRASFVLAKD